MATLTTFTAGTPILSADVNANFEALNADLALVTPTLNGAVIVGDGTGPREVVGTCVMTFVHTGTLAAGQTSYLGFKESATLPPVEWHMPFACLIQDLRVVVATAPGGAETLVFTVYENGSATAVTATISGVLTTGNDLTHTENISIGGRLAVEVVASASAASTTHVRATLTVSPR